MADCPRNEICPFYSHYVQTIPDRANELRERYCLGNYLACARYAVAKAKGGTAVPISLFPHQHAEARTLIASSQE